MRPFSKLVLLVTGGVLLLGSTTVFAAIYIRHKHDFFIVPTGEFVHSTCALPGTTQYATIWSADYGAQTTDCAPYFCDQANGLCKTQCTSNADCVREPGITCNHATGACVWTDYTCKDSFTRLSANGVESTCRPYKCEAARCKDSCATQSDCAEHHACRGGKCVPGCRDTAECHISHGTAFVCDIYWGECKKSCTYDQDCPSGYLCQSNMCNAPTTSTTVTTESGIGW